MSTFTAPERLYKNPDGQIVTQADVEDGATLAAAMGDEFSNEEADRLGLRSGAPADAAGLPSHLVATAVADIARAKAAMGQLGQAQDLADASTGTEAEKGAAIAQDRLSVVEAVRTARGSVKAAQDAGHTVPGEQLEKLADAADAVKPVAKRAAKPSDKQAAKPADK